jgi:hypothetical protein
VGRHEDISIHRFDSFGYSFYRIFTMKSVAAIALLASTAAAFVSQQESRASTSLAAFDDALGVQEPLGFW